MIKSYLEKLENISKKGFPAVIFSDLFLSIAFSVLVMLPFLTHSVFQNTQWFWGSDNSVINIPVISYFAKLTKELSFWGIDFYSVGGAKETVSWGFLYYGPNMLLPLFFFPIDSFKSIYQLLYLIFFIHFTLSFYGCFKLSRFFDYKGVYRFFLPCFYVISVTSLTDFRHQYIFFLSSSLFPLSVYSGLALIKNFSLKKAFYLSLYPFCLLTTGYMPMSFFGFILGGLFSLTYTTYVKKLSFKKAFKIQLSYIIAGIAAAPLYLTIQSYLKATGFLSLNTLFHSAWNQSQDPLNLLAVNLSRGYHNSIEKIIHIPYIIIFLLVCYAFNGHKTKSRLFNLCFVLVAIQTLTIFGATSAFSTYFYYLKIPGRNLVRNSVMLQLFMGIGLTIIIKSFFEHLETKTKTFSFYLGLSILVIYFILIKYNMLPSHRGVHFEIVLLFTFSLALFFFDDIKLTIVLLILFIIAPPLSYYHSYLEHHDKKKNRFLVLRTNEYTKFFDFLKENSTKKIIKYRNLIPKRWWRIDYSGSSTYFQSYIPYWMSNQLATGNYRCNITKCYPKEFMQFPDSTVKRIKHQVKHTKYNYLNQAPRIDMTPRWNMLQQTEAEFVIYDAKIKEFTKLLEINNYIDNKKPKLQINSSGMLFTVAHIKQLEFDDKIYSNGFIRVRGEDKKAKIEDFKTNEVNYISFNINSTSKLRLDYLFIKNRLLKFYVDGVLAKKKEDAGILHIYIPKGSHKIELKFVNIKGLIFNSVYLLYILILFSFFCYTIYNYGKNRKRYFV